MKPRQSNMELLRMLSMMAVIMVHLDGAALGLPTPGSVAALTASDTWRIAMESITITGVNCFTLISGYFGIRARLGGLFRFTLTCVCYSVIIYSVSAVVHPSVWSWQRWFETWMVFTHTDLWYVPAYLLLYLLSPVLNACVSTMSLRQLRLWLGLFVLFNVWGGWLWNGGFNPTGYTPLQLIMMYLIGRYMSLYKDVSGRRLLQTRSIAIATWVLSTLVTALLALWMEPAKVYAYNAPWVIISSVALTLGFTTFSFQSLTINSLARGAFAAYLIHKNPAVWGGVIKPAAVHVWTQGSLIAYTLFSFALTAGIYFLSCGADAVRRWLFRQGKTIFGNKIKIDA